MFDNMPSIANKGTNASITDTDYTSATTDSITDNTPKALGLLARKR